MLAHHADVSPDELRRFAALLNAINERLETDVKQLMAQFKTLGTSSWRDQVYQRFAQEFEETMLVITNFTKNSSEKHIPFLLKKAQKAEDYLS